MILRVNASYNDVANINPLPHGDGVQPNPVGPFYLFSLSSLGVYSTYTPIRPPMYDLQ